VPEPITIEELLRERGVRMRIGVLEAQQALAATLINSNPPVERIALAHAHGRCLAEDLHIAHALPPFSNSAMDGYACRHADLQQTSLRVIGESRAGARFVGVIGAGQCVRISTGAMLPGGADTVVIQEDTSRSGDQVQVTQTPSIGANIRQKGEECAAGARLLKRGTRLQARELALAASAGRVELRVVARPRVSIISTGDELAAPNQPLGAGQIYDSNAALLQALLIEAGAYPLPASRATADDPERLAEALRRATSADLIITTGGASVGDHDHMPQLLAENGCVHFWKVRMKPGMPVLFGEFAGKPVLALPGNPVSVFITFRVLAQAAIQAWQGLLPADPIRWPARLAAPLRKSHARAEYLRGVYRVDTSGQLWVRPLLGQESHRSLSLTQASVLLPLPEGPVDLPAGAIINIEPLFAAAPTESGE